MVYGNVKPSWVWRLKAPDSFLVLQDSLLRGFVPLGKIHARVRSGSRSFLSAMHSTGRQNTYHSAGLFDLPPTGKLTASVAGDRLYRSFGILGKRIDDRFCHRLSFPVRYFNCNIISRLSLRKCRKAYFAFPLPRYHRVRFPMPELFAIVYALIPFAYAFPCREPSTVSQPLPCFPFPAQVFKGGTKIPFVYPTINGLERRHLYPARRFGDLFGRPRLRQFLVYVIQHLLFPKYPAVAKTAAQAAFLLCRMRIIPRDIPENVQFRLNSRDTELTFLPKSLAISL